MTKIETFRWRMWHVYLLIFITILLTGTFVRYGYRIQSAYSLDDRLYDYTNKKVTVTSFQNVKIGKDRKSTRLNSSHIQKSRMPSSA